MGAGGGRVAPLGTCGRTDGARAWGCRAWSGDESAPGRAGAEQGRGPRAAARRVRRRVDGCNGGDVVTGGAHVSRARRRTAHGLHARHADSRPVRASAAAGRHCAFWAEWKHCPRAGQGAAAVTSVTCGMHLLPGPGRPHCTAHAVASRRLQASIIKQRRLVSPSALAASVPPRLDRVCPRLPAPSLSPSHHLLPPCLSFATLTAAHPIRHVRPPLHPFPSVAHAHPHVC